MWFIAQAFAAEDAALCTEWAPTEGPFDVIVDETVGEIQSSGLAASRTEDGVYYTHDDQGGRPVLYVFRDDGEYIGLQNIVGATNTDWEDLAPGPCPETVDAEACLWIADTGEADETRSQLTLWVVPESTRASESAVACNVVFPNGKQFDAEALLVSPDGIVRIVTKEDDGAKVYRISAPACDGGAAQTLTLETELALDEKVTGGAMSRDGGTVVLRGLDRAWMWSGCTLDWSVEPLAIDLGSQPQGEAIAFTNDGALITTSETHSAEEPLRYWKTPCAASSTESCPDCGCGEDTAALLLLPLLALARRGRARRR